MFKNLLVRGVIVLLIAYILFSVGMYLFARLDLPSDGAVTGSALPDFEEQDTQEPPSTPPAAITPDQPRPSAESAPPSEPPTSEEPSPLESAEPPAEETPGLGLTALPVRMRIPALSLDYEIQPTGADKAGTMQIVPALEVISWFELSSIPGNSGNAILGGHNMWKGTRSRIYDLDKLKIGDELEIGYDDGTNHVFYLESVFVYLLATAPADLIMDVGGDARLTLITCKPPFNSTTGTSDNRIVATFKEAGVYVFPDPPIEPFPPLETAGSNLQT